MSQGNYSINVPDIGEGIAEVEIVEWPLAVGDSIEEDDVICVVMSDKATVEIPSPVDGIIRWLGAEPGETMAVGSEFIRLETTDKVGVEAIETAPIAEKSIEFATPVVSTNIPDSTVPPDSTITPIESTGTTETRLSAVKAVASPAVRQRARDAGINLDYVKGSGPADRISHQDLDNFIIDKNNPTASRLLTSAGLPNTEVKDIKIIGLRRKIASIMQDTMQRIPHFTYVEEVDVTELEKLRQKLNKNRTEKQPKLTVLPFIIKALVQSIKIFPEMSSRYNDIENSIQQFSAAHVGIATQTDNGLVVPVVRHAEALDLWQSADEIKRLSTAARTGTAKSDELNGSSITITSLGPMGGIVTTPVINSPEVAIIGINKIAKRPIWIDGAFQPRDIMNLSSSFDHRIIDGWEATQFVQQIKSFLETPALLFMES